MGKLFFSAALRRQGGFAAILFVLFLYAGPKADPHVFVCKDSCLLVCSTRQEEC